MCGQLFKELWKVTSGVELSRCYPKISIKNCVENIVYDKSLVHVCPHYEKQKQNIAKKMRNKKQKQNTKPQDLFMYLMLIT